MSLQVFDERLAFQATKTFDNASGTSPSTLFTAGASGARIDALLLNNDDTVDHVIEFYTTAASGAAHIGSVNVPAGSGYAGTPSVDAMATLAQAAIGGWLFEGGATVSAYLDVTLTSGKVMETVCIGGHF